MVKPFVRPAGGRFVGPTGSGSGIDQKLALAGTFSILLLLDSQATNLSHLRA